MLTAPGADFELHYDKPEIEEEDEEGRRVVFAKLARLRYHGEVSAAIAPSHLPLVRALAVHQRHVCIMSVQNGAAALRLQRLIAVHGLLERSQWGGGAQAKLLQSCNLEPARTQYYISTGRRGNLFDMALRAKQPGAGIQGGRRAGMCITGLPRASVQPQASTPWPCSV